MRFAFVKIIFLYVEIHVYRCCIKTSYLNFWRKWLFGQLSITILFANKYHLQYWLIMYPYTPLCYYLFAKNNFLNIFCSFFPKAGKLRYEVLIRQHQYAWFGKDFGLQICKVIFLTCMLDMYVWVGSICQQFLSSFFLSTHTVVMHTCTCMVWRWKCKVLVCTYCITFS
jgi:hypothetical protein